MDEENMMTFKQYLVESDGGNYVSMRVVDFPDYAKALKDKFGAKEICSKAKLHVTLIYSENTEIKNADIRKFVKSFPEEVTAEITRASAFDCKNYDDLCTIVLEVESTTLIKLHSKLKGFGLTHSYDEFKPHVSVAYHFPRDKKAEVLKYLTNTMAGKTVTLKKYTVQQIDKNWSPS